MTGIKQKLCPLLAALLLLSLLLARTIPLEASAPQEMTPKWTIEDENLFTKLAISADGEYIAASTNNTNTLYVFHEDELLWTSPTDPVSSLAMAANGEYIAVGTERSFRLFTRGRSTPRIDFKLDAVTSFVAISASGNTTAIGTTSPTHADGNTTRFYLIENETSTPIWNTTAPGTLDSLSMSDDGNYFAASTSHPGILYLFSREEAKPLWMYNLGERSGGAKISHDGSHLVVVGANQLSDEDIRIYQFQRQRMIPHYMKVISELSSFSSLSISANGSIFAISHTGSLMLFNLDLPPYGYGPGSVLKTTLPRHRVSMAMSSDGRHIIVGTIEGIFAYEYADHQLNLRKQYTVSAPFITDVALSASGQFIIAATVARENSEHSTIHAFDNFRESQTTLIPFAQLAILVILVAAVIAATTYVLRRRRMSHERAI